MKGLLLLVVAAVALISLITTTHGVTEEAQPFHFVAFDGCPSGPDSRWNITWANTAPNETDEQPCPGGVVESKGVATRLCTMNDTWAEPNILECESQQFYDLRLQAERFFSANTTTEQILAESGTLTALLVAATQTESDRSLLPADLNTTNNILTTVITALENSSSNTSAPSNDVITDIFNNVLEEKHVDAWMALQEVSPGSQVLLDNAERYGHHLARSLNDTKSSQVLSRNNIVINSNRIGAASVNTSEISFPEEEDLVNYTHHQVRPARIVIPGQLLQENSSWIGFNGTIPIVHILFRNVCLLRTVDGDVTDKPASVVISSQVGDHRARSTVTSDVLQQNPISVHFDFPPVSGIHNLTCAYWNFSDPVGYGNWETDGITTSDIETVGNVTSVKCLSTHLTSFTVLVDVAGGVKDIPKVEQKALQIISYIGCAISVVCLIISVVFFLLQGKKLFRAVHMFVHLNLSISLLLGYLTFVSGIETATGSSVGCAFVAALLHYLFLAAFCWMLCEGVMLYFMLVAVFSKFSKKWWFFLILGWVTPLPIVVTAVASRHEYYGVKDNETDSHNNESDYMYCWMSVEKGTIFAFVAPALVIILVNVIFLCCAVRILLKSQQFLLSTKESKTTAKILILAKSTFKATVILLPLLGLTWVFGVLAIDTNTSVFAWLFTICNSTQGVLILFFHVIRSEMVWSKISQWFTIIRHRTVSSILRSQKSEVSSSMGTTSDLPNGGTLKAKNKANKDKNDYEITPLPKQSGTIEVAKFTSVAYSEEDHDISMSNDVPKEGEDTSNSSSSDDFKATQPGMEKCGRSSVPRE